MEPECDHVRLVFWEGWRDGVARYGLLRVTFQWYALYVVRAATRLQLRESRSGRRPDTATALGRLHLGDLYLAAACDAASAAAWIRLERSLLPRVQHSLRLQDAGGELAHRIRACPRRSVLCFPPNRGGLPMSSLPDLRTQPRVSYLRLSRGPLPKVRSIVELAGPSYCEFFVPCDEEFASVQVGEELGCFTYEPPMELRAEALLSTSTSRVRVTRNEPASGGMRLVVVEERLGTE